MCLQKGLCTRRQIPPFFNMGGNGRHTVFHERHGGNNGAHGCLVGHVGDVLGRHSATPAHTTDICLGVVFNRGCPTFYPAADILQPMQTTIIAQCYYGCSIPPFRRFEHKERFVVLNIGKPSPFCGIPAYIQGVVVS